MAVILTFSCERVENVCGGRKNFDYHHFPPYQKMFIYTSYLKSWDCVVQG